MARFVHDGNSVDYTPSSPVAAGDVVVQGNLVGVATRPIPANTLGALAVSGVFEFAKAADDGGIDAGEHVYIDADTQIVSNSSEGGEVYLGICVADAATSDEVVRVKLAQAAPAASV